MATRTFYPTLDEALFLDEKLSAQFGGTAGVLDKGLLESALARLRSVNYSSLSEQGVALMQSLAINHCFADGNKRIAFALTATFFLMNGYRIKVTAIEAEQFLINEVIISKASLGSVATWLE